MKKLKIGDKSKAVCEDCEGMVSTTFMLRDVPFSDGQGLVEQVLVGVCDKCDSVVSLPHQSSLAIKKARDKILASQNNTKF